MYQIGQRVVYGIHGVCKITGQVERKVDKKNVTYLVLEPADQSGSQFLVPLHNPVAMGKLRPMLSKEDLEALLQSERVHMDTWIPDENRRKQTYRELIGSGDRTRLMQMVHTLYRHQISQAAKGRKCHLCDENFLRDAEKLLMSEVTVTLGLEQDQARSYIRTKLRGDA